MPVPAAPADLSGGFLSIKYTNGGDTHHQRVHVLPFSTTRFIVGGGTPSVSVDDGNHDYAYQPDRPAGQEAGISDTFAAWCAVIKGYYHSDWTLSLDALYQVAGNVATEIFPLPVVTPVVGTSPNADAALQARAGELIFNARTRLGNRARVMLVGQNAVGYGLAPSITSGSSGGTSALDQAVVAYLVGAATAIVGHDGQKMQSPMKVTNVINRRLRRRYGYA
jgi:hypothetical protein